MNKINNLLEEAGHYIHAQLSNDIHNTDWSRKDVINEEHGYIPNIDEYVARITDYARTYIRLMMKNSETSTKFSLYSNIFDGIKTFFNGCEIDFNISLGDENNYSCYYSPIKSSYFKATKSFYPYFSFTIFGVSEKAIIDMISLNAAHEMTHSYEDYKRRIGERTSLHNYAKQTGYYDFANKNNSEDFNSKILSMVIYRLSNQELNAIIGQLKTELISSGKEINNTVDCLELIEETEAFEIYQIIAQNVNAILYEIDNKETQDELLKAFNSKSKFQAKDYNHFKRIIKNRWMKWKNHFLKQLSKIVYDIYKKQQEGKMIDTKTNSNLKIK